MKCSNCGGELIFIEGIGVCGNCGSKIRAQSVFEKTEVCICYIENDINGRRTKDSIIANEVYKKLESKNINSFYARISVANAIGEELEMLCYNAFYNAKIIIFVGTNSENFEELYKQNKEHLYNKKIIPVISDVKPECLPDELKGFQASNFDALGALEDLSISILNILGREDEVELKAIYQKSAKKKKIITTITFSVIAIIICTLAIIAVLLWPQKEEPVILTNDDIYNSAITLLNEGKYLEAASEFHKIPDYKDSINQFEKIYDRYDGYYTDETKTCSLYINVIDGKTIEFSFEKTIKNKTVKVEESLIFENNKVSGKYIDSMQNKGAVTIIFNNKTIALQLTTEPTEKEINFGDINIYFQTENKTDRPLIKSITKELLLNWISSTTHPEDIRTAGYELKYIDPGNGAWDAQGTAKCSISNTDIVIVFCYDREASDITEEMCTVTAVIAPAELVCPESIGQSVSTFTQGEFIYQLNAVSGWFTTDHTQRTYFEFLYSDQAVYPGKLITNSQYIQKNSAIGVALKNIVG